MIKIKVANAKPVEIQSFKNVKGGDLFVAEYKKEIPFQIKRIYFINNFDKSTVRGRHAHRNINQAFFCINGNCKLKLHDGFKSQTVSLTKPNEGVLLGPALWREFHGFSDHCVILVLADKLHSEKDYFRDFKEFQKYARQIRK